MQGNLAEPLKAAIRSAFLELRDPEVLRAFRVEGFAPTSDEAYNILRETARLLEMDLNAVRG
jgi:phosphonate transport system substrate-binding protein